MVRSSVNVCCTKYSLIWNTPTKKHTKCLVGFKLGAYMNTLSSFVNINQIPNFFVCSGAIKFGDVLTQTECQALILALSHCNLPFQCAHGR